MSQKSAIGARLLPGFRQTLRAGSHGRRGAAIGIGHDRNSVTVMRKGASMPAMTEICPSRRRHDIELSPVMRRDSTIRARICPRLL